MRRSLLLLVPALLACTDDAELPTAPETTGPRGVGVITSSFDIAKWGSYKFNVFYPASADGGLQAAADTSGAPYLVMVYAHGHQGSKDANTWVGRHLASWGYVCLHFSTPAPAGTELDQWTDGIASSIDQLQVLGQAGLLAGMIDASRAAAIGHSMGGRGALKAAGQDGRIKAVVTQGVCRGETGPLSAVKAAVQLQAGSLDGSCPPADDVYLYERLGKPKQLLVIEGGNHIGFINAGVMYEAAKILIKSGVVKDQPATISRDEQERIARRYLTAWLEVYLRGDAAYEPYLSGEPAAADRDEGRLSKLQQAR